MNNTKILIWWVLVCVVVIIIVMNVDFTNTWPSMKISEGWLRTGTPDNRSIVKPPIHKTDHIKTKKLNVSNDESNTQTGLKMTTIDSNHILTPNTQSNNLEDTWYKMRQEIMSKRKPGDTIKVFYFAHMRGGSTLSGKIFESDPNAVLWYEPGDAFFSYYHGVPALNQPRSDLYFNNMTRRIFDGAEKEDLSNFYTNKFTCQYQALPPESLAHQFLENTNSFIPFKRCIQAKIKRKYFSLKQCKGKLSPVCRSVRTALVNKCHVLIGITRMILKQNPNISDISVLTKLVQDWPNDSLQINQQIAAKFISHQQCLNKLDEENKKCMSVAVTDCESHSLQVVQVNRMKMEDLKPLIQANPDIYIIHYVRDPRGIAQSRHPRDLVDEARYLCHRMAEDLRQRHILEEKYPGLFLQVRYEDLTAYPIKTVSDIYSFLGKDAPLKKWQSFVAENMHAPNAANHSGQGTRVNDAVATANKWKTLIPENEQRAIESFCGEYLKEMNYTLFYT